MLKGVVLNMSEAIVKIHNCNNIESGEIPICASKLNILFGCNGTGKTTIAKAIQFASEENSLAGLTPYTVREKSVSPEVDGVFFENVAVFDDEYVRQFVFQPDSLIKDAFEILIRTREYDEAKKNIDDAMSSIRSRISEGEKISALKQQINTLIDNIEFTEKGDKLAKRKGGIKSALKGKGAYFNPPEELRDLRPFFEEATVSKWAAWRLQGLSEFGDKGLCPYCSGNDTEQIRTINRVFSESFDKASVEYVSAIRKSIEALKDYLDMSKADELILLFGSKESVSNLESQLAKLGSEAHYLNDRLRMIGSFNGSSVGYNDIASLESKLGEMKIDTRRCDVFFVSDMMKKEIASINDEIDALLTKVGELKAEIGKYNSYVRNQTTSRKKDINDFLRVAGFKYEFDVDIKGEGDARAMLKFVIPDCDPGTVESPREHLSWGERHAFALVLFMFDAISRNADLVILDDPISSFDNNKKFAIINRLFKTGDRKNSLYQRTVLMLTHDFEPVIDYIQVGAGRQDPSAVCAKYLENTDGKLNCVPIQKDRDLMSSVVLFKVLAEDCSIDIAARIGCLRKFIEHQVRIPREESEAYNVLSSLVHGRNEPTRGPEGSSKLTAEEIMKGEAYIKHFIEDFNYESILGNCKPERLLERYLIEKSSFVRILILRFYIQQDAKARKRLQTTNDVLRKYVDETYHIENDYLYSLDVRRFNIVPDHYINDANEFVAEENARLAS